MKSLLHASALIASLILAGVAGAEGAPESQALEIGAPMPMADVKMKNVDGKEPRSRT